jgi:hypothetical protein
MLRFIPQILIKNTKSDTKIPHWINRARIAPLSRALPKAAA